MRMPGIWGSLELSAHLQGLLHPVADNGEFGMVFWVLQKFVRQPEVPLHIPCTAAQPCHAK